MSLSEATLLCQTLVNRLTSALVTETCFLAADIARGSGGDAQEAARSEREADNYTACANFTSGWKDDLTLCCLLKSIARFVDWAASERMVLVAVSRREKAAGLEVGIY